MKAIDRKVDSEAAKDAEKEIKERADPQKRFQKIKAESDQPMLDKVKSLVREGHPEDTIWDSALFLRSGPYALALSTLVLNLSDGWNLPGGGKAEQGRVYLMNGEYEWVLHAEAVLLPFRRKIAERDEHHVQEI